MHAAWVRVAPSQEPSAQEQPGGALELSIRADLRFGRALDLANNAWLLEMPDPLTHLTWENAVLLAPVDAARLGVVDGDLVELRALPDPSAATARVARAPVLVQREVAPGVAVVHAGWGRALPLARGAGFSVRDFQNFQRIEISRSGRRKRLARTWSPAAEEEQGTVRIPRASEARGASPSLRTPLSIYSEQPAAPAGTPQWGMSVDVDACTGCSACVVACQAENNVAVVGRDGVVARREMHWLRIDTIDDAFVPMMCQHCETAPCEIVCPVAATLHSDDGLNQMIYNRCVGTRFCSNNCPYKVRRFNWLDYRRDQPDVVALAMNPDVTVRSRGVMEKCTYCVQRIRAAVIEAGVEQRPIRDGEVVTACAQTCPAGAIVFGRVDDPGARVARLHEDPRAFAFLAEEGTRPRTRYLAPRTQRQSDDDDDGDVARPGGAR